MGLRFDLRRITSCCKKRLLVRWTITIRAKHLAECDRLWVSPPVGSDGKMIEGQWFDIDLLEIVTPSDVNYVGSQITADRAGFGNWVATDGPRK